MSPGGTISWPSFFGAGAEPWFGFVLVAYSFEGVVPKRNQDGRRVEDLLALLGLAGYAERPITALSRRPGAAGHVRRGRASTPDHPGPHVISAPNFRRPSAKGASRT